jgi:mediator of RNA polymerase II transcription subunit 31
VDGELTASPPLLIVRTSHCLLLLSASDMQRCCRQVPRSQLLSMSTASAAAALSAPPSLPPLLTAITSDDDAALPALSALFNRGVTSPSPPMRFQLELEFVSLLSNPFYLHHLASSGYLSSPHFLTYLRYLRLSFCSPPLLSEVSHPHALHVLRLLCTSAEFRTALLSRGYVELLHGQQFWHWRSFRYNRYRESRESTESTDSTDSTRGGNDAMHSGTDRERQTDSSSSSSSSNLMT